MDLESLRAKSERRAAIASFIARIEERRAARRFRAATAPARTDEEVAFQPAEPDTLRRYAAYPRWKREEAVSLLLGYEPFVTLSLISEWELHTWSGPWERLHELMQRAEECGELEMPGKPDEILAWARRCKVPLPAELVRIVAEFHPRVRSREGGSDSEELSGPDLTKYNKLLRLALGMAILKFGFDPRSDRQGTADKIEEALKDLRQTRNFDLTANADTIRRRLNEAAEASDLKADVDRRIQQPNPR